MTDNTPGSSVYGLEHPFNVPQAKVTRPEWYEEKSGLRSLLPYITESEKYQERVLRITPDVVLIRDKFPKAHVHLLLLPRWTPHRDYHPHDAFEDPAFLNMMRREAAIGLQLATQMLRTDMQKSLTQMKLSAKSIEKLLDERDPSQDFHVGVHGHPSQHELHVHIMSRDMVSKHDYSSRHYQSFNTHFLVPLNEYPLQRDDIRRRVKFQNQNLMKEDFQCWKCGKDFDTDWQSLKQHLNKEWSNWIEQGSAMYMSRPELPSASGDTTQDNNAAAANI